MWLESLARGSIGLRYSTFPPPEHPPGENSTAVTPCLHSAPTHFHEATQKRQARQEGRSPSVIRLNTFKLMLSVVKIANIILTTKRNNIWGGGVSYTPLWYHSWQLGVGHNQGGKNMKAGTVDTLSRFKSAEDNKIVWDLGAVKSA